MGVDLAGRPNKERIIHVERFGQKRPQGDDHRQRQCPLGMSRGPLPGFVPPTPAPKRCYSIHVRCFIPIQIPFPILILVRLSRRFPGRLSPLPEFYE